jgi:predicted negative regulator of RcsB-dependent stress response
LRAVELTSDDPTIMEHLGDVYSEKGDTLKALEFYERGLRLAGDDKEVRDRLVRKINNIKQIINAQRSKTEI